jgi:hypothetical protein
LSARDNGAGGQGLKRFMVQTTGEMAVMAGLATVSAFGPPNPASISTQVALLIGGLDLEDNEYRFSLTVPVDRIAVARPIGGMGARLGRAGSTRITHFERV